MVSGGAASVVEVVEPAAGAVVAVELVDVVVSSLPRLQAETVRSAHSSSEAKDRIRGSVEPH